MLIVTPVFSQGVHHIAQIKPKPAAVKPVGQAAKPVKMSAQLAEFTRIAATANVIFTFPKGFKEIKAPDNDYFSFDYAMALPGKDLEIWLLVKSQKENWASYEKSKDSPGAEQANPDSTYSSLAEANAAAFTGDDKHFVKNIPPEVLEKYNADAGKSYLLNLRDQPATKRYKYALLITLQKSHTGIIMAVCFTNDKGPEFFKNMDKAANSMKFKP
ncbi:hypothetical protein [Mucilaginibacter xinganensis]|uniref:PsbP C-terminal domain-containing protein n=1 Tax=Mucilaginibacter xinganensis TaxID=1234841 RepID=A0A223P2Q1_9SPHI|nr:hypothetical protein [Mucilaginibacter xinganensis]ASU36320.1 hypothetical protein MuYL_4435 [Mucilaginibacter xinganensis]